jgi:hypothetical protein
VSVLRRLNIRQLGWLQFKLVLGILWPLSLIFLTPASLLGSIGWIVYLIASATLTGTAVSVTGLILSAQGGAKATVGLSIELAGLALFTVGPFAYFLIYLTLCFTGYGKFPGTIYVPSTCFAYAMVAAITCRILIVAPARSRQARSVKP